MVKTKKHKKLAIKFKQQNIENNEQNMKLKIQSKASKRKQQLKLLKKK